MLAEYIQRLRDTQQHESIAKWAKLSSAMAAFLTEQDIYTANFTANAIEHNCIPQALTLLYYGAIGASALWTLYKTIKIGSEEDLKAAGINWHSTDG